METKPTMGQENKRSTTTYKRSKDVKRTEGQRPARRRTSFEGEREREKKEFETGIG